MKLVSIAKQPALIRIELDDEDTIKEFGEALEFWCYDRQPLDSFMKFANRGNDSQVMVDILKEMVLDEDGNPVIKDGLILPTKVMVRVATKLMDTLGNL
jgi:hypothetical protein